MIDKQYKIGAYVMVHNMAPLIPACISSISSWVDGIFIYDDHSTDGSLEVAKASAICPVFSEKSKSTDVSFRTGELEVRNYLIDRAFEVLGVDILIILDADELLSEEIKPEILRVIEIDRFDSICFSTFHLYDENRYIHLWEADINGTKLIDPHTRIIKKGKYFTPLFGDGSHPTLEPTTKTLCLDKPLHFHLKYFNKSSLPNYSLFFLPERITEDDVNPYLRPITLPDNIKRLVNKIDWDSMPEYKELPHYSSQRIKFNDPSEALIHPKDRPLR